MNGASRDQVVELWAAIVRQRTARYGAEHPKTMSAILSWETARFTRDLPSVMSRRARHRKSA